MERCILKPYLYKPYYFLYMYLYMRYKNEYFCVFSGPQEHCMLELIPYNALSIHLKMIHSYNATLYFLIHLHHRVPVLSYHPIFIYLIFYSLLHSGTPYILFYTYYKFYIFITNITYLGTLYLL